MAKSKRFEILLGMRTQSCPRAAMNELPPVAKCEFLFSYEEILALCLIATLKCGLCLYLFVGVKIGLQSAD
jgi:hypothetical protein